MAKQAYARTIMPDGPQAGDVLVFVESNRHGAIIEPADLREGQPPVLVWAMDPASRHIRNGSRLNQLLLLRSNSDATPGTRGILAFSAICTHANCAVTGWRPKEYLLLCPCHGSLYDPERGAAVVDGPAPRPLPQLPVTIKRSLLTVAGPFTSQIGGTSSRAD